MKHSEVPIGSYVIHVREFTPMYCMPDRVVQPTLAIRYGKVVEQLEDGTTAIERSSGNKYIASRGECEVLSYEQYCVALAQAFIEDCVYSGKPASFHSFSYNRRA